MSDLMGLSQNDAIRRAIAEVGPRGPLVVEWLADHGRPGVKPQRVYDVIRRDAQARARAQAREAARALGMPPAPAKSGKTAAPGTAEGARLAAAWAAEAPPDPGGGSEGTYPGGECDGDCGAALLWQGAQTTVVCEAGHKWVRSPGAARRAVTLLSGPPWARKRVAKTAGPSRAERDAQARGAHAARRKFLRGLDALGEDRRLSPDALDILDAYRDQAAETSRMPPAEALARLAELFADLQAESLPRRHWWNSDVEPDEVFGDDDQGDDDAQAVPPAALSGAEIIGDALAGMIGPGRAPALPLAPTYSEHLTPRAGYRPCAYCRREGRRDGSGRYPPATIRAETRPGAPGPAMPSTDMCDSHYAAVAQAGAPIVAAERYPGSPPAPAVLTGVIHRSGEARR